MIACDRIEPGIPRRFEKCFVSIVLPVYNEAAVLKELVSLVEETLLECGCRYEVLFVNDGSTDGTSESLDALAARDPHIRVLHLSRNFGHQSAVHAGLCHAGGDAVVIMDSDLQDDPRAIRSFLERWADGYDVVYAIRRDRKEKAVKRGLFYAFYRVLNAVSRTQVPMDAGNFGLMDRRVARQISALGEVDRYFPGLRSWVGFRQTGVPVARGRRYDDHPRVSLMGLFRLAKSALFSFSSFPLTLFYAIAGLSLSTCVGVTGYALFHKVVTQFAIPGWASTTIVASFFGALNALGIGILGEYAIRIYDQVRNRPQYIVARSTNIEPAVRPNQAALLGWLSEHWPARGPAQSDQDNAVDTVSAGPISRT